MLGNTTLGGERCLGLLLKTHLLIGPSDNDSNASQIAKPSCTDPRLLFSISRCHCRRKVVSNPQLARSVAVVLVHNGMHFAQHCAASKAHCILCWRILTAVFVPTLRRSGRHERS